MPPPVPIPLFDTNHGKGLARDILYRRLSSEKRLCRLTIRQTAPGTGCSTEIRALLPNVELTRSTRRRYETIIPPRPANFFGYCEVYIIEQYQMPAYFLPTWTRIVDSGTLFLDATAGDRAASPRNPEISMRSLTVSLAILVGSSAAALAQTPPTAPPSADETTYRDPAAGDTVRGRSRPDYDPVGLRAGSFFIYPKIAMTALYRDNIFFTDGNQQSDLAAEIAPSVNARSNWNNHALNFYAGVEAGRYLDHSAEDYTDGRAGFDGRLDIQDDLNVTGGFDYEHLHETRSSPDQVGAAEPVTFDRFGPKVQLTKRFNRVSAQIGGEATEYSFDNVAAVGGGTIVSSDRDRREFEETARLGYEISPQLETFVRGSFNQIRYDRTPDSSGVNRDSQGWEIAGGVAIDFGGVTFGNVYVGYLSQDFEQSGFDTVDGVGFGGDITWNVTRLTTVTFEAMRTVDETTLAGASGALASAAKLSVDHELLRNLIVSMNARYAVTDFKGISREDDTAGVGIGANYLINRMFSAGVSYSYATRDSNAANADYTSNTALVRLTAQF